MKNGKQNKAAALDTRKWDWNSYLPRIINIQRMSFPVPFYLAHVFQLLVRLAKRLLSQNTLNPLRQLKPVKRANSRQKGT
jgi:hypothetical protein